MSLTLHVGAGTFLPVREEDVARHQMAPEHVEIPEPTANAVGAAKRTGRRVVAVGTTTVRALEGCFPNSVTRACSGDVSLFITPGHAFAVVDALLTNFHLPRSTLLMLVGAFADPEFLLDGIPRGRRPRVSLLQLRRRDADPMSERPFRFELLARDECSQARRGRIHTARGPVETPAFMPVATVGAVKGVTPAELRVLGAEIVLANAYHLSLRPGARYDSGARRAFVIHGVGWARAHRQRRIPSLQPCRARSAGGGRRPLPFASRWIAPVSDSRAGRRDRGSARRRRDDAAR